MNELRQVLAVRSGTHQLQQLKDYQEKMFADWRRSVHCSALVTQVLVSGDASLGEWEEWTGNAFHLRRRLSDKEALLVGEILDIRGTDEAKKRAEVVIKQCPFVPRDWIMQEIGL